jgi:hypothetical protein
MRAATLQRQVDQFGSFARSTNRHLRQGFLHIFLAMVHLFLFQSQFLNVRAWHSLDIFFASAICF